MEEKDVGLIWMSAGNSYFTEENIKRVLNQSSKNFKKIIILSPSNPAEHNFKALDYTEKEAKRKAKLDSNRLINRAKKVLKNFPEKEKFRIEYWENIEKEEEYQKQKNIILKIFNQNKEFRRETRNLTKKALQSLMKTRNRKVTPILNEGIYYILEELAFILASPTIYNSKNTSYIYHKNLGLIKELIAGKYDGIKRENIYFELTKTN